MDKIYLGICKTHTVSHITHIIYHLSGQEGTESNGIG